MLLWAATCSSLAKSYLMLPLSPQMFLVCVLWRLIFMLELPFQLKANLRAGLVTLEQYLASVGAISPATGWKKSRGRWWRRNWALFWTSWCWGGLHLHCWCDPWPNHHWAPLACPPAFRSYCRSRTKHTGQYDRWSCCCENNQTQCENFQAPKNGHIAVDLGLTGKLLEGT